MLVKVCLDSADIIGQNAQANEENIFYFQDDLDRRSTNIR